MNALVAGLVVFFSACAGALFGFYVQERLPQHHRNPASNDTVKVATGFVVTMVAVVVGFMVTSARNGYEIKRQELAKIGAMAMHLDRILALYGSGAAEARRLLRESLANSLAIAPYAHDRASMLEPNPILTRLEEAVEGLLPANDNERTLKADALSTCLAMGEKRWELLQQRSDIVEMTFVWIVIFWILVIFLGFGLFAPRNLTALIAFAVSALSVSLAIFFILELDSPFSGFLQLSTQPLTYALRLMGP
jgi:hypothetical protein